MAQYPPQEDPRGVACASLGFAAFIAKRRKSPGLDLRVQGIHMATTPRGSHMDKYQADKMALLVAVRPLWGRGVGVVLTYRRSRPAVMHM